MDIQAEKLSLVQAILEIEDISLIKKVKKILKSRDHDWFDDLNRRTATRRNTGIGAGRQR